MAVRIDSKREPFRVDDEQPQIMGSKDPEPSETTPLTQRVSKRAIDNPGITCLICASLVVLALAVVVLTIATATSQTGCSGPAEDGFNPACAAAAVPDAPVATSSNVSLVLSGMQTVGDVEAALRLPGLTHLWLYNNAATRACDATDAGARGAYCGMPCAQLLEAVNASGSAVRLRCVDRPNSGRGEAGFFEHVVSQYEALDGTLVFSQSTLTNEQGRLEHVADYVASADSRPTCLVGERTHAPTDVSSMCAGQLLAGGVHWSLRQPAGRGCYACSTPVAAPATEELLCNVTLSLGDVSSLWPESVGGEVTYSNVCGATPPTMAAWLAAYAPGPASTVAPACYLGFARSNAEGVRRRPKAHYAAMARELNKCANPEASHFVERAMLYLFASI